MCENCNSIILYHAALLEKVVEAGVTCDWEQAKNLLILHNESKEQDPKDAQAQKYIIRSFQAAATFYQEIKDATTDIVEGLTVEEFIDLITDMGLDWKVDKVGSSNTIEYLMNNLMGQNNK